MRTNLALMADTEDDWDLGTFFTLFASTCVPPLSFQEATIVHSRSFHSLFVLHCSLPYCTWSVFEDFEELCSQICPEDLKASKINAMANMLCEKPSGI